MGGVMKGQIWRNNETKGDKEITEVGKFKLWFSDGTYIQRSSLLKYYTLLS